MSKATDKLEQDLIRAVEDFHAALFSERVWLGGSNLTWRNFQSKYGLYIPQPNGLWTAFLFIPAIAIIQVLFQRFVGEPLGVYLGLSDVKPKRAPYHSTLETVFKSQKNQSISPAEIKRAYGITEMSERQIAEWLFKRSNQGKPSPMNRFKESLWKFFIYLFMSLFGLFTLWDKSWLTDFDQIFNNYPRQHVTPLHYWYILTQVGLYLYLILAILTKENVWDFKYLLFHHLTTFGLQFIVWTLNLLRYASLVLFIFDVSDFLLETTKCIMNMNKKSLGMKVSYVFTGYWYLSRLIIFPFKLYAVFLRYVQRNHPVYNSYHVILAGLSIIMALNVYWTYIISSSLWRSLKTLADVKRENNLRRLAEENSSAKGKVKEKR